MTVTSTAAPAATPAATPPSPHLHAQYQAVRAQSERLSAPLEPEDCVVQSMPDVSPTKWHLAHTTWFFETFVLQPAIDGYRPFDPAFGYLFNSYYNAVGQRHPRPQRGLLSRPSMAEVFEYRRAIDEQMERLLESPLPDALGCVVEIGLHHEQQHQELILTDIKHVFSVNPLRPAYQPAAAAPSADHRIDPHRWIRVEGGVREIGHAGESFCFDNEQPRHRVYVEAYELASRPVTAGEYLQFIEDGGYERPELWLSDGWAAVGREGWSAPLYWERESGAWRMFTLSGMRAVEASEPVAHVSFYEADAYARWSGARLPTEAEWEIAALAEPLEGHFVESERYHPRPGKPAGGRLLQQMFGDVWEWTGSAYAPYPGYRPNAGALGEYNGKFMCNQMVLRGGSCATPRSHIRPTYRNFFYPDQRWQFTGIRLARDGER